MDSSELPPHAGAVLELIGARYRLGETAWTVHSKHRPALRRLESEGLVGWKEGVVEHSCLAWLTEEGKKSTLSSTYKPPALAKAWDEGVKVGRLQGENGFIAGTWQYLYKVKNPYE